MKKAGNKSGCSAGLGVHLKLTYTFSHIRSSEDVSSGYSSAEPLYTAQHATKSEGLVTSGEPLVRTASVGSTRSMRTKSSRGGVVVKRGSAAAAAAAAAAEVRIFILV